MGGIVSLENEINVYEYEDDEWLDETDSDYGDDMEEEAEESPEPEPESEEEYNRQIEWETEKISHFEDDVRRYIVEEQKEPLQFERENMKIEVQGKKKDAMLGLTMSTTAASQTPQMSSPMTEFGGMQFAAESTGAIGQKNELINKHNIPKPLKRVIYIDRGGKKAENKNIKSGKNFADRLAMFKHLEETKGIINILVYIGVYLYNYSNKTGGRPQILEQSKAYAMINKFQTNNKGKGNNGTINKANPLNDISQTSKNIHVTKSTMLSPLRHNRNRSQQVNVLKITKTKAHTLKPRLFGYMNVIRSSFIPIWKASQNPRYFFVLDGLPSKTNTMEQEPDFDKDRTHDFLVPSLFFFKDKNDYNIFEAKVKNIPARDIKFQKLFAKYAKGVYPLNEYAMHINIFSCTKRLNELKQRNDIKLPISEINNVGVCDAKTILLCNDKEIHRFNCDDKFNRNKWVKKVNKLVDKRKKRLNDINNRLLNVNNNGNNDLFYDDDDGMMTPTQRASVIGGSPRASSMYKVSMYK